MHGIVAKHTDARATLAKLLAALILSALCVTTSPFDAQADEGASAKQADYPAIALNAQDAPGEEDAAEGEPAPGALVADDVTPSASDAPGDALGEAAVPTPNEATASERALQTTATSDDATAPESTLQAGTAEDELAATTSTFTYQHDPRNNPSAMKDIIADIAAVYGFRPSPDGSLKQFADADWSDPAVVEKGRQDRLAYHKSIEALYDILATMQAAGASTEEIARAVSTKRNEIRMASYANDPEGLARLKARNLEEYGNENGGTPEYFFNKYGSWETVIEKSFSVNSGMDACLGLYDIYYSLYVASGQVPPDKIEPHRQDDSSNAENGTAPNTAARIAATPSATTPSTLPATGDNSPASALVTLFAAASLVAAGSYRRANAERKAA